MLQLCTVQLGWDQPLEGEMLMKWKTLVNDLQGVTVPSCYFGNKADSADYHLYSFCDACTMAYAAVVYLVRLDNAQKSSSLSSQNSCATQPFSYPN